MALANGTTDNGTEVKKADRLDLGGSITQGDAMPEGGGLLGGFPGLYQIVLSGNRAFIGTDAELLPPLPGYWTQARDNALSQSINYEGFWDIAVSIAVTKATATVFEVEGSVDLQARKGQELFNDHTNGGQGWDHFASVSVEDFLLNDKGTFIEVDRVDNSKPGARVRGLYHLDSHRCYLTGNPDRPVIYQDLHGVFHWLSWWQVFHITDRPTPRNIYFKVGRCAASRAYPRIRYMVAGQALDYQEMTGSKANTLELLSNLPPQQLEGIFETDKTTRELMKQSTVQGNVILATLISKDTPGHITIKLRSKPADWNAETVLEHTAIWYSDALGMDKADLKPFTGQMAGTATQSIISHNKQQGKGLIVYKNSLQWYMSEMVLPTQASFHWIDSDLAQKKAEAELFNTWADGVTKLTKDTPLLSGPQGLQVMVDKDQVDREFLPNGEDVTPGVTLEDDEKLLYPPGQEPVTGAAPARLPAPANTAVSEAVGRIREAVAQKLGR